MPHTTKTKFEEGYPLDGPGDEALDADGMTIWARVTVDDLDKVYNEFVFQREEHGRTREGGVYCLHLVAYAATLEELDKIAEQDPGLRSLANKPNKRVVDLAPEEHFNALKSYVAGLSSVGIFTILKAGIQPGFNEHWHKQVLMALFRVGGSNTLNALAFLGSSLGAPMKRTMARTILGMLRYRDGIQGLYDLLVSLIKDPSLLFNIAKDVFPLDDETPPTLGNLFLQELEKYASNGLLKGPLIDFQMFLSHLVFNYDRSSPEVQKLLFSFTEHFPYYVIFALIEALNDESPEALYDLLINLVEKIPDLTPVAEVLNERYESLPSQETNKILRILLNRGKTAGVLEFCLLNYSILEEEMKKELRITAKDDQRAGSLALLIVKHYEKMPEEIRSLLNEISLVHGAGGLVAQAILTSYRILPEDFRNNIFTLAKRPELDGIIARCIYVHARHLPNAIVDLLPSRAPQFLQQLEAEIQEEPPKLKQYEDILHRQKLDRRVDPHLREEILRLLASRGDREIRNRIQLLHQRY